MTRLSAAILLMAAICALLAAGCGKKEWPEPKASEDRFAFTRVTAQRNGACLTVEAELSGAFFRVDGTTLQVQKVGPGGACPGCPFTPDRMFDFTPGQAGMHKMGNYLRVSTCELDPEATYAWRLFAKNSLSGIGPVMSEVGFSEPAIQP